MRYSQAEYNWLLAKEEQRKQKRLGNSAPPADAVEQEDKLHTEIIQECKRRGWIYLHGSMAHRTKRSPGEPDFVILGSVQTQWVDGTGKSWEPRVWFIECKSKRGKRSMDQLAMAAHASKLGHTIHVIQSFSEFLGIVDG